ncbi:hypothetical protein RJ640_026366 [Escallonia rubra]|uniref:Reverse transcriptase Ty1/copia-type domain-containing protein n=1 Tax=Escallonia rubra TaxID=112253 RepID=A0AA88U9W9_9ASTE|nr:hypothetical protein RJ640_026366 [Escallonia rubra]
MISRRKWPRSLKIEIALISYYLGIEVKQRDDGTFMSQEAYAKEVLKTFNMENCNPISIPIEMEKKLSRHIKEGLVDQTLFRSLVGSLRYLTYTRPDILCAVGLVSRYMENPTTYHFKVAKRILCIAKKKVQVKFMKSDDQVADIFPKPLKREVFEKLRNRLGMRE